jgi:hypothetical protein
MTWPILLLILLLSGCALSLSRKGIAARVFVALSVPAGAFLGALAGGLVGWISFRLNGQAESQHDWMAWTLAGWMGMFIGLIILPAVAMAITGKKNDSTQDR